MIVRKVRGQDKVERIIVSYFETEVCKKMGIPVETWVKQQLLLIAKKRRWKWYLNKEKGT